MLKHHEVFQLSVNWPGQQIPKLSKNVIVNILTNSKVYLSKIKTCYLGEIISEELDFTNMWALCIVGTIDTAHRMRNEISEDNQQIVLLSPRSIYTKLYFQGFEKWNQYPCQHGHLL